MKLILCDINTGLCNEWRYLFGKQSNVIVVNDKFQNVEGYDCIVSPGNSFGLMDGGIDLEIVKYFGPNLAPRVKLYIRNNYYGEQPVGTSFIIPTGHQKHPFLAHTPTMRAPMDISQTDNVYNAMRAMLIEVLNSGMETVLCPGLGTLTGRMPFKKAAWQMYYAYQNILNPLPMNWDNAVIINNACREAPKGPYLPKL